MQKQIEQEESIRTYLLEFVDDKSEPAREIGLSESGAIVYSTSAKEKRHSAGLFSMKNGFVESKMTLNDFFKEFRCTEIDVAEFERAWARCQHDTN